MELHHPPESRQSIDNSCEAPKRISTPYLDPKVFDGSPYEASKYAERRDDVGRMLLAAMMQARHRIAQAPAE